MKEKEAVMIWTPDGVWLQTVDAYGRIRSDYCGRLPWAEVEEFCRRRGLCFEAVRGEGREVFPALSGVAA